MKNFHKLHNPPRSPTRSFIIFICLSLLFSHCGLFESDINKATHKTQIVVSLAGEYAHLEEASVSVGDYYLGTITANTVATQELEPGTYNLIALDRGTNGAWETGNVTIKEGETFNYTLLCNPVYLTIAVSAKCGEPGKANGALRTKTMVDGLDVNNFLDIVPGESGVLKLNHGWIDVTLYDNDKKQFGHYNKYVKYNTRAT